MKFEKRDSLIRFHGKPDLRLYVSFILYAVVILGSAIVLAVVGHNQARLKVYFYVDLCTALMLAWFIAKSFRTQPLEKHVTAFRTGLFVLFNALGVVLAGCVRLIAPDIAILAASLLLIPAMFLIILSFNHFIAYINTSYKSVVDLSLSDELTGLPNRRYLNLIFRELDKKSGTLCILDIDHFKRINDTFGHETGDKVLTTIGLILDDFINDDIFIARSGGEEFCIIMSDRVDAEKTLEAIKAALTIAYSHDIKITVSAGMTGKRRNEHFTLAMIAADEALYRAKRSGRNCIVYAKQ